MGVYMIKCLINGKVYIGKSNDVKRSGEPYNPQKKSLLHLKGIQILECKIN